MQHDNVSPPIDFARSSGGIFCDSLRVTLPDPFGSDAWRDCRGVLSAEGYSEVSAGVYLKPGERPAKVWREEKYGLSVVNIGGAALADLRRSGNCAEFLTLVATRPHRVTRLDATLDFRTDAAPWVHAFHARALAGGLRLSQKPIPGTGCVAYLGAAHYDAHQVTGTVYVGKGGQQRAQATIYDKRQERMHRGVPDPGPWLRVEVKCGRHVGMTLGDAMSPERLFYHFASPDIVKAPSGMGEWSPQAEGFAMQSRREFTPAERIDRLLAASLDVAQLLELARAMPGGVEYVQRQLGRRAQQSTTPLTPSRRAA